MSQKLDLIYCSECSREVGENLYGSAPRVDVWVLLEYAGAWGAKAVPESDLSEAVKARLIDWSESIANTKVLFVRSRTTTDCARLFVALAREFDPVMYCFELDSYDALLAIDLEAVIRRDAAFDARRYSDPLLAVCTNGRRDISCAKYGLPVYRELERIAPQWAWESSHMGGHRFAGTIVALPDGVVYGYVDPDDVEEIVMDYRDRYVVVSKMRGRSCYDAPVQAAEYYLRGITGIDSLPGLKLISVLPLPESVWSARFIALADCSLHEVHVRREMSAWTTFESSIDAEPKHIPQYHLVGHRELRRKAPHCEG
jgi:hypothetical protein